MRLLAAPAADGPAAGAVVVGTSTEDRDDAMRSLSAILAVGGIALLFASAAGYGLASAALRPVEAMRRRAAEISGDGDRGAPAGARGARRGPPAWARR